MGLMKYLLIIGDGMADNPVPELSNQTPLETADKPFIDALAKNGEVGSVRTVPEQLSPGSDTAILSIFGCDPRRFFAGRSPLEAAGCGFIVPDGSISFRCNMISLEDGDKSFDDKKILSHNAGSIDGVLSYTIMRALMEEPEFAAALLEMNLKIFPTHSFRHIVVQKGGNLDGLRITAPHDILGKTVGEHRHSGSVTADMLWSLMRLANRKLEHLPQNETRRREGKLPANGIWLWAEGKSIALPNFVENYGKTGSVISAVPLVHGIGVLTGLKKIEVPGATGEVDTNYAGKINAAKRALCTEDEFLCVHIEAPDEATHNGSLSDKLLAIHQLDDLVVRPLVEFMNEKTMQYRILMLSDHKTLMSTRTHDGDPVPYLLYDSRSTNGCGRPYTEASGKEGRFLENGTELMELLFERI